MRLHVEMLRPRGIRTDRVPPRACLLAWLSVIGSLLGAVPPLAAQPSGGPYGPIHQTYEVPKAPHVYYVAPDGRADASGTTLSEPTRSSCAAASTARADSF